MLTDLRVSFLACKCVFYRPEHYAKGGPMEWKFEFVMCCAIWYHLNNLENVKNTYGGLLPLVKWHALICNFTKSNTSGYFSRF